MNRITIKFIFYALSCIVSIPRNSICEEQSDHSIPLQLAATDSVASIGKGKASEYFLKKKEDDKGKFSVLLKGSYDFPGSYTTVSNSDLGGLDVKSGISITGELIYPVTNKDFLVLISL